MPTEKLTLTAAMLKNLKPGTSLYEVRDAGAPGLRVRIYPNGRKTFRWMAKSPQGKNITITLGEFPKMSLAEARSALDIKKAEHSESLITGEIINSAPATMSELAEIYISRRIKPHLRSASEVEAVIRLHIVKPLGSRKVANITVGACRQLVEGLVDDGKHARAKTVLMRLKHMLDFALVQGLLNVNPASALKPENLGIVTTVKDRVLTPKEIRIFNNALNNHRRLSEQVKIAFRILLLTGTRTGELLKAKWENVNFKDGTWTIPVSDQKIKKSSEHRAKPFVIPLAPLTIELLKNAKSLASGSPFIMASQSKTGRLEDKSLGHAVRRMLEPTLTDPETGLKMGRLNIPRFTPHDLRRTMRTELGKLGVAPHIAERCLNHSLGRIVETYDHGDYLAERREALNLWASKLECYMEAQDHGR